jgi:K(+)-stimulated pyrophosphate-energized sodium pump
MSMLWAFGVMADSTEVVSAAGNLNSASTHDMFLGIPMLWWIAPAASIVALLMAVVFYKKMMAANEGNAKMIEIAGYVREGAMAYLFRQYKIVGIVFAVLVAIFAGLAFFDIQNPFVPVAFLTGGFFSGLCGYIGMKTATNASSRTAQAASEGLNRGLQVAFRSGAVMGLVVVGLGLLDICIWYWLLDQVFFSPENMANGLEIFGLTLVEEGCTYTEKFTHITTTMLTFGMGASTQALFARVGGGIYTKAADVGADLVGKVEAGIPEDDPRNPATIADNVGDNVGDVAGMGADLYESYCGSVLATAALGAAVAAESAPGSVDVLSLVLAPMIVAGMGTLLSIVGISMVKCKEGATQKDLLRSLLTGTLGSSILILVAAAFLVFMDFITWGIFGSIVAGLFAGVIIGQGTEYYTSDEYAPTQGIANQAKMGPATTIIDGLATGMYSTGIPVATICLGILFSFGFAGGFSNFAMGLYGVGFAAVGMLSTLGITLATDAYGPIADNAGGNAEMAGLPPEVRQRTDALDSLGNTTAATGKGFAIGSAALTAMALLASYMEEVRLWAVKLGLAAKDTAVGVAEVTAVKIETVVDAAAQTVTETVNAVAVAGPSVLERMMIDYKLHLLNPLLLCGLFIGAMMAFVFCAMTMKAVGRAAGSMVEEVRAQFKAKPGIMAGTEKPDYARCVAISTAGAQREMLLPSLLAITVPVATGLVLGIPGVVGMLAGGLVTSFTLATMLNNAGGAWDNAKKYIEKGAHGGKKLPDGSKNPVHAAAVIGDTVGDPCKDTSGPSLNILIKLMTMVSIVFAPVVLKFSPAIQAMLGIN